MAQGAVDLRTIARRHLEILAARPRPAGGHDEAQAREYCRQVLTTSGLAVSEEPFSYSALPGRAGTPVLGATSAVLFTALGHLAWRGRADVALGLLVVGAAVGVLAARWLTRVGILALPWMRSESSNLVAVRGNPSLWLVAHLDSKSQPVPILVRALGIIGLLGSAALAAVTAVLQLAGNDVRAAWPVITAIGVLSSLPVAASTVAARSPGALDDASGVSAVLLVAQRLPPQLAIGVVLTSAEELGLAGARAWVRDRGASHAINIDGVDDEGDLRLTWTGRRPSGLIEQLAARARDAGVKARSSRLPPGALVDAIALADAGWHAVTISRGTLRTVARIHTPRDSVDHLGGDGVALTASIILAAMTAGA